MTHHSDSQPTLTPAQRDQLAQDLRTDAAIARRLEEHEDWADEHERRYGRWDRCAEGRR